MAYQAEIAPNTKSMYSLVTNHFPFELEQNHTICLYNVQINPEIQIEATMFVRTLLRPHREELK